MERVSEIVMNSPQEELLRFQLSVVTEIRQWEVRLLESPGVLFEIEKDADACFRNAAGRIVACLLASTSKSREVEAVVAALPAEADVPLRTPSRVNRVVKLLCGIVLEITTLYCAPARSAKTDGVTEKREGIYPELAAYGFAKGVSSALEDRIVRAAALYPSLEVAQRELSGEGLDLDVKTIRRVTLQCGETLSALRREKIERFLEGTLPVGNSLRNKNVVVEEDGGRMRQRENIAAKIKKPGAHPKFKAEWREPKLFVIYRVDEDLPSRHIASRPIIRFALLRSVSRRPYFRS